MPKFLGYLPTGNPCTFDSDCQSNSCCKERITFPQTTYNWVCDSSYSSDCLATKGDAAAGAVVGGVLAAYILCPCITCICIIWCCIRM